MEQRGEARWRLLRKDPETAVKELYWREEALGIDDGREKDLRRWTWDKGWTEMGVKKDQDKLVFTDASKRDVVIVKTEGFKSPDKSFSCVQIDKKECIWEHLLRKSCNHLYLIHYLLTFKIILLNISLSLLHVQSIWTYKEGFQLTDTLHRVLNARLLFCLCIALCLMWNWCVLPVLILRQIPGSQWSCLP